MKEFAIVTVIGGDKTGVVARITSFLFEQKGNIEALEEQVTRGQFSMTLQTSWPAGKVPRAALEAGLARFARDLGMEIRIRWANPKQRQRMVMMVTAEEHCARALLDAWRAGNLRADIAAVISNRRALAVLAREFNLPFHYVPWHDRPAAERRTLKLLEQLEADFVVLARFMKILSPNFVWRYKNKIINVHPSLLPSFPGPQAYRQAYEYGVKIIGVTSHFVSMRLDEGPIIAQASAPVPPGATLKQIVALGQKLESKVLLRAVRLYLAKRLDVYWGIVREI